MSKKKNKSYWYWHSKAWSHNIPYEIWNVRIQIEEQLHLLTWPDDYDQFGNVKRAEIAGSSHYDGLMRAENITFDEMIELIYLQSKNIDKHKIYKQIIQLNEHYKNINCMFKTMGFCLRTLTILMWIFFIFIILKLNWTYNFL